MMRCERTRNLGLHALAGTLPEADRIALEAHLGECEPCRDAQARIRLFEVIQAEEPRALSAQKRSTAIERALGEASLAPAIRTAWLGRRMVVLAAGLVGVALVGALLLGRRAPDASPRVIADGRDVGVAPRARGPRVLAFGSARVEPSADAEVEWSAGDDTLTLARGEVRVSVPDGGSSIRVATDRFVVVALASRFVATPRRVAVEFGWARIEDPSGREIARLRAGEEWSLEAEPPRTCESCGPLLREAASKLARGRVEEARDVARGVLALGPSAAQAAEANLLLADASRLAGDRPDAIRRYLHVARTFRGAAAENALYAAAQLETPAAAGLLLAEYLRKHPDGRFAAAARERLEGSR